MELHEIMLARVRRQADHGALKPMIRRVRGSRALRTTSATIKGLAIMHRIRRGHGRLKDRGAKGEIRFLSFPRGFTG
jgi:hypothetical protein